MRMYVAAVAHNAVVSEPILPPCRGFSYNAAGEPVPGDLIIAVGGERVQSSEDILAIIEQFDAGDMVPITVLRGREQLIVNVTVKEVNEK
jgi:S1-C subfamily serine protease